MLFHLEFIPRENWGPADAPTVQKAAMEWVNVIMKSGKVKESGLYADERGGFFIIDVETPLELLGLVAPIIDVVGITSHPIVSMETLQKLFQEMTNLVQTLNFPLFFYIQTLLFLFSTISSIGLVWGLGY